MTSKKVVTGTKVITGNRDLDFVSAVPFEVNDVQLIGDENVVNAIRCDLSCKIFKKFILVDPELPPGGGGHRWLHE